MSDWLTWFILAAAAAVLIWFLHREGRRLKSDSFEDWRDRQW